MFVDSLPFLKLRESTVFGEAHVPRLKGIANAER